MPIPLGVAGGIGGALEGLSQYLTQQQQQKLAQQKLAQDQANTDLQRQIQMFTAMSADEARKSADADRDRAFAQTQAKNITEMAAPTFPGQAPNPLSPTDVSTLQQGGFGSRVAPVTLPGAGLSIPTGGFGGGFDLPNIAATLKPTQAQVDANTARQDADKKAKDAADQAAKIKDAEDKAYQAYLDFRTKNPKSKPEEQLFTYQNALGGIDTGHDWKQRLPALAEEINIEQAAREAAARAAQSPTLQKFTPEDIDATIEGMATGHIPPVFANRDAQSQLKIIGGLQRRGVNLAKLQLQWRAANDWVNSIQSSGMVQQRVNLGQAIQMAQELKERSAEYQRASLTPITWAQLKKDLASNNPQAIQFNTALNMMKEELKTVYGKGTSGTDKDLENASDVLNSDWDAKGLGAAIDQVQRTFNFRAMNMANPKASLDTGVFGNLGGAGGGQSVTLSVGPDGKIIVGGGGQ